MYLLSLQHYVYLPMMALSLFPSVADEQCFLCQGWHAAA